MKICPNCGAENSDGALKCILCDYEFDDLDSNTFEDNTETDYHETSDNKPAHKANDNADDERISSDFVGYYPNVSLYVIRYNSQNGGEKNQRNG